MLGAIVAFASGSHAIGLPRITVTRMNLPMQEAYCLRFALPCTQDSFFKKSAAAQARIVKHLCRRMHKFGVDCVYPGKLPAPFLQGKFFLPDGRRIFCAFAGQIIERHYRAFSFTPQTVRVCVYAKNFDKNALEAAQYMAQYTNHLCLVSPDTDAAHTAAQILLQEHGLTASVTDNEKQLGRADITLLLSAPETQISSAGLVLDFDGKYPYSARRDVYFNTAFGYAPFLDDFGRADGKSAEFILCCYGLEREKDVRKALLSMGWKKA